MEYYATYRCQQHPDPFDCPDNLITYRERSGDYGIIIYGGGASYVKINLCPWCGKVLDNSRTK